VYIYVLVTPSLIWWRRVLVYGSFLISLLIDKFILYSVLLFVFFSLFSCSPFHTFFCSFIFCYFMLISLHGNVKKWHRYFFCLFYFSVAFHYVIASIFLFLFLWINSSLGMWFFLVVSCMKFCYIHLFIFSSQTLSLICMKLILSL